MENIIKQGMANLWKGKEAVGGKLYLTSHQLIHKPHKINIQSDQVELNLVDIDHVELYTNKIFGLSLMKNGLTVVDKDRNEYKFVVNKREDWKNEIEKLLGN
ncbi:GRAM domain-containing protein [Oceanobacillus manasiensis]|uniref:GRAM domain-containing protein n=1 Tax=Oceanobacillus manasiensis TaxID=586413 RepID=UPI0005A81B3E|nr:GRAM domain-containing protein [Oceanobacillus manasiensis]